MQIKWLDSTLSHSKCKWKVAVGHHPLFTTGARRNGLRDVRQSFLPYFEKYQVDAYFAGHEHDLQHQKPEGHTHYFVSGAGSELRPVTVDVKQTMFAVSENGFMNVSIFYNELVLSVVNIQGKVIYSYNLNKY